ncbi:hypothetical protein AND_010270 [Anopheles darlingi]|uniref:Uncharacterized protein n=1 Tax=Anopheles darlingi TaxID=43151 RepID=W5J466_ANODA|nr:hypothetical protein AND_010270 [Anopheles darlingi]
MFFQRLPVGWFRNPPAAFAGESIIGMAFGHFLPFEAMAEVVGRKGLRKFRHLRRRLYGGGEAYLPT